MNAELLAAAQPDGWRASAAGWRALGTAAATRADEVDSVRRRLAAYWRGPAATAALATLTALVTALRSLRVPILACDQALSEHATRVDGLQRQLGAEPTALGSAAWADEPRAQSLAADAAAADARAASRLAAVDFAAALATGGLASAALTRPGGGPGSGPGGPAGGPDPAALPPPGSDPFMVRVWWDSLPPAQRALLTAVAPAALGGLDGIPVAVRDTANRQVLADALAHTPAGTRHLVLAALTDRLGRAEPARAYLVGFDPSGDGRAVVAIGDPDEARHVVTNVPGAGSDLDDLRGLLARTERIAAAARGTAGTGGTGDAVSSVLWLGYDAPEWLSAAGTGAARAGAADLDRFVEGMRVTAEGPPAHHTIVGHSYGSLVVGTAAAGSGLPADDLVFVGSPGVGVDHAGDLGLPAGHVWAGTARWDVIRAAGLADRCPDWFDTDVTEDRWHGADPGHPSFGGHPFASDPGSWRDPVTAHNAYFDEGNAALRAIGAIARGDYGQVTPP